MPLNSRNRIIIILVCVLIPVGIAILTLARNHSENRKPLPRNEPIVVAPYNELIETRDGEKLIRNTHCGFTYEIPMDWSVIGLLGESKILSPEDRQRNAEWDKTHQDIIENAEGDAPGLDARSLYIGCQYGDAKSYIDGFSSGPIKYKDLFGKTTLADAFQSDSFHSKNSNLALIKNLEINGKAAYEISQTGKMFDGTVITNFMIVLGQERIMEIDLGQTEYDHLPEAVKTIIHSISLEK